MENAMANTTNLTPQQYAATRLVSVMLLGFLALVTICSSAFAAESSGWKNQELKVKGTWSIEQRVDGDYLVVSDDFKTKKAPDLKFFLTKANYSTVNGNNAKDGAVLVAKLKSTKGAAEYKIPSNINVSDYNSLILHCEQYSKLWASTPLK